MAVKKYSTIVKNLTALVPTLELVTLGQELVLNDISVLTIVVVDVTLRLKRTDYTYTLKAVKLIPYSTTTKLCTQCLHKNSSPNTVL